jgi:hypothetical protein
MHLAALVAVLLAQLAAQGAEAAFPDLSGYPSLIPGLNLSFMGITTLHAHALDRFTALRALCVQSDSSSSSLAPQDR